jgi:predicted NBD/HSP70 family sugar kinase
VAESPADATLINGLSAARPALIRTMNEQLLLEHIRTAGPYSRAELARVSGLSKPTVSLALANLERAGLVRHAGQRTGVPGRSALLYEIRPEAGFVLGLDIGLRYLRGALADLAGEVRARLSVPVSATSVPGRVAELVRLADDLCARAGISRESVTQAVVGSPGVYDPQHNLMALTGGLPGWDRPEALASLREAFGPALAIENDVDAAALAERALGHGRDVDNFAFVHIGTGIGMGLVLGGRLHRGVHGVAGEIAFMPLGSAGSADDHQGDHDHDSGAEPAINGYSGVGSGANGDSGADGDSDGDSGAADPGPDSATDPGPDSATDPGPDSATDPGPDSATDAGADSDGDSGGDPGVDPEEARRRGTLEVAAAADGIVRAARRAGMRGSVSARSVFEAAAQGDPRAAAVVAAEARLVASAICCVITVIDPSLIVLGGGIGQAPGFADAVTLALAATAPVLPEVKVSALGTEVVVDGCLAEGASLAWNRLVAALP